MSIFEALGYGYVILGTAVFTIVLVILALHGIKRLELRFKDGLRFEESLRNEEALKIVRTR